ncbi:M23 family metallopeptidase [Streptomyces sp. Tu 3180]|uniref:M23 family metallopeptidase n=1 Tax=Streptomyces sp. Tu 3180 TaxID=2682611 RepID=UPI0013574E7C|nr:M23 family metallopeptidase [Streptomyces sp. Tu 3180]KAF3467080.1 M23 family metallopeptidase [Streptomyces sp. Tu 3180]
MNDRHPSGTMAPAPASDAASAHYASYGTQEAQYGDFTSYGGHDAAGSAPTGFGTGGHTFAGFATDPLFGDLPGGGHDTGAYDTAHWSAGGHDTAQYDAYAAQQHTGYDTGAYDATAWTTGQQHVPPIPQQGTAPDVSGQWDAGAWLQPDQSGNPVDQTQHWDWGTQAFDTGAYDATQWNSDGGTAPATDAYGQQGESFDQQATATFEQYEDPRSSPAFPSQNSGSPAPEEQDSHAQDPHDDPAQGDPDGTGELPAVHLLEEQEEVVPVPSPRAASRGGSRSRRRTPPKRSALLTVAVPSACVMGVAGIAAASVGNLTDDGGETATTAADAQPVKPSVANIELDTQLESLAAGADDFADRASRTQERIDLRAQQEAERRRAAEEAARKERLRPKFALPVAQHGLSAYYGQSGTNWMSVHTGIDFPVPYGSTVMAATDGTVRTQFNVSYGNMMIVTAKDGTETWYCHLSSYRVAPGTTVKAGDPIAFSGNSGKSTGPHLHFEVRPGGGSTIDPLAWLRSHGLNPS